MTLIKICGITTLEDALACVAAGADALGFNFYPGSRRYVRPEVVRQITEQLAPEILTIGVFVNEPSPELVRIALAEAGVTGAQLHGDESPDYCATLADKFVIKVVRGMSSCTDIEHAEQYDTSALMIDTFDPLERGGTGRLSDWSFACRLSLLTPRLFLAGGLSPENVAEGIKTVAPYAVDACTALESSPGRKDLKRVRAFIEAVQQAR